MFNRLVLLTNTMNNTLSNLTSSSTGAAPVSAKHDGDYTGLILAVSMLFLCATVFLGQRYYLEQRLSRERNRLFSRQGNQPANAVAENYQSGESARNTASGI